jgi:hypothetical protein
MGSDPADQGDIGKEPDLDSPVEFLEIPQDRCPDQLEFVRRERRGGGRAGNAHAILFRECA